MEDCGGGLFTGTVRPDHVTAGLRIHLQHDSAKLPQVLLFKSIGYLVESSSIHIYCQSNNHGLTGHRTPLK